MRRSPFEPKRTFFELAAVPTLRSCVLHYPNHRSSKAGGFPDGVAIVSQQAASDSNHLNRRWRPALMSFFLRRVRNHAEAEDLTQEVFARLLTDGGRPSQSPDSYIFQVAVNLLRDGARRSKVRTEYLRDAALLDGQDVELLDPSRVVGARAALALRSGRSSPGSQRCRNGLGPFSFCTASRIWIWIRSPAASASPRARSRNK